MSKGLVLSKVTFFFETYCCKFKVVGACEVVVVVLTLTCEKVVGVTAVATVLDGTVVVVTVVDGTALVVTVVYGTVVDGTVVVSTVRYEALGYEAAMYGAVVNETIGDRTGADNEVDAGVNELKYLSDEIT